MTWYVTVAAVRIHGWIHQTPKLTHMRGASKGLRFFTLPSQVRGLAAGGVTIIDAYSQVDGVVVAEASGEPEARGFARDLTAHLGHKLPGVHWEAWWQDASTYPKAFEQSLDLESPQRMERLPALQENGVVKSCLLCRAEPAGATGATVTPFDSDVDGGPEERNPGAGCAVRASMANHKDPHSLHETLPGKPTKDFDELAKLGGLPFRPDERDRRPRNHLATIYADGNGMGALFHVLATTPLNLRSMHAQAIEELNAVTQQAVAHAAVAAAPNPEWRVAEPHFVGGDDVLISVPADRAWVFASQLALAFEDLRKSLNDLLEEDLKGQPVASASADAARLRSIIGTVSLGVGMTIAHSSFPFADAVEAAEASLHAAKKDSGGRASHVAWVDATAQYSQTSRQAAYLIEAAVARTQLHDPSAAPRLFALPPAARSQLGSILRDPAYGEDEDARRAAVTTWAGRLTDADAKEQIIRDADDLTTLAAQLSRARWWPSVNREVSR